LNGILEPLEALLERSLSATSDCAPEMLHVNGEKARIGDRVAADPVPDPHPRSYLAFNPHSVSALASRCSGFAQGTPARSGSLRRVRETKGGISRWDAFFVSGRRRP
jgi:hypothetical protein